jgi:peptidylamidoglycolate lyase
MSVTKNRPKEQRASKQASKQDEKNLKSTASGGPNQSVKVDQIRLTQSPSVSKLICAVSVSVFMISAVRDHRAAADAGTWAQEAPTHQAPYRVVRGWPILPEGYVLGQVSGVAIDSHNNVFVFHRADHSVVRPPTPIQVPTIMVFNADTGKLVTSWGANTFVLPHGLRIDPDDNVWVTDVALHQVFKFTHDGKLLMTLGTKSTPGCDSKHFNMPTDVAFASDGAFYVSDGYGNSRVAKFSADGTFLFDWGHKGDRPGEFNLPHSVAVGPKGRVYVADRSNSRIQIFDKDGRFIASWKSSELGRPWGLAFGHDGDVYMVDGGDLLKRPPDHARILRIDLDGHILEKWSSFGNQDGQIYWGHDIAVGNNGDVFVGGRPLRDAGAKIHPQREGIRLPPAIETSRIIATAGFSSGVGYFRSSPTYFGSAWGTELDRELSLPLYIEAEFD